MQGTRSFGDDLWDVACCPHGMQLKGGGLGDGCLPTLSTCRVPAAQPRTCMHRPNLWGPRSPLPTVLREEPGRQMEDSIYPLAPEREQLSPLRNIWRKNSWPQAWLLQVTPTVYRRVAGRISEHGDNVKEVKDWHGRMAAPKQCPLCQWVTDASFQRVRWTAAHSRATTIPTLQQMNVHSCS